MKREKVYCKVLKADVFKDTKGCLDYTCLTCPVLVGESTPKQIPKKVSITKNVKTQKPTGVKKKLEESYHAMPSTLDEWIDREIERCHKGCEDNNDGALNDVLYYFIKYKKPLPEWAGVLLLKFYQKFLSGNIKKKKGRHPIWIKQYKQDMKDFVRADTVQECIDHGIKWDDVYFAASELLKGTFAKGSEHTIEKSYKRYKQRIEEKPYRYMILRSIRTPDTNLPLTPERAEILKNVNLLGRKK